MSIYTSEPFQVELFKKAIQNIQTVNPVMIELGCAEAEYSQLFCSFFNNNCINICIDILPRQLIKAKKTCPSAEIIHGYVGKKIHRGEIEENNFNAPRVLINNYIDRYKKIDMLHMDVQGAEPYVLEEIHKNLNNINFIFISLHETYEEVKKLITEQFEYVYEHPTFGGQGDGLIVIKNKNF
jgi:hypothetical protein